MPAELLFMPDYRADPIWDVATKSMVSLDRLPISEPTRSAIRGWASRWEQLAEQAMHFDDVNNGMLVGRAEPVAPHAWERIERDGRALCQRLRAELGDRWRVGWVSFEHEQRHVQWKAEGPVTPLLPGTGREARARRARHPGDPRGGKPS